MSVTFYNNWKQKIELDLICVKYKNFEEDEQIGFALAFLGFGMVIVINKI